MKAQPFRIAIDPSALDDLRDRLRRTRWPQAIEGIDWEDGTALAYAQDLVAYWRDRFDWPAQEIALNRLPHFTAAIDDLTIHFIHQRGRGPRPLPLIISHGWPGSFVEMTKILPLLTDPAKHGGDAADAFDVVIPSLPGYGFSSRPLHAGTDPRRIAELWVTLMTGLGYERFGAQGGDWGSAITASLGFFHPEHLVGIHLNMISGSAAPPAAGGRPFTAAEEAFRAARVEWAEAEGGYHHIQRTKPLTLAYGLNDSPAGLAAWIVEKFRTWSDCNGDVESVFTRDELLTNIAIYWFTETIGSSVRLYREALRRPLRFKAGERVTVPTGVARFPKEIVQPPREWAERIYNLQHWKEMARGGHFAAMEQPELLAADIRAFFRPLRTA